MIRYPQDELYREMAFLAYYLHWPLQTLLEMEHSERRRWCREVSEINRNLDAPEDRSVSLESLE